MKKQKHTTVIGKSEEPHNKWDTKYYVKGVTSARRIPLNHVFFKIKYLKIKEYKMIDKFICPIDVCPTCKSKKTFHKRQQSLKNQISNVWVTKRETDNRTYLITKKYDLCLDCQKVFLIEYFGFTINKSNWMKYLTYIKNRFKNSL